MIGKTLAHYKIVEKIGAGGMGEVYRATDSRLGRDVALKLLPETFARDPERMARFRREAQVLAQLNHTNIAAIYGLETEGDSTALVLELVEGPTLEDRIRQAPLALVDALPIARQIAEAIESAHEAGIIHRDLKPANVKLTPQGNAKVLDFGLAKAFADDPAQSAVDSGADSATMSPTFTSPVITGALTGANVILGTAPYMSPEQARAKPVDKRSDVWAFGVVCFEMLTGRRLFEGETVSDTLAAVLKTEPDWDTLPEDTPEPFVRLLQRCLERDPRKRLRDIGEARILLEDWQRDPASLAAPAPPAVDAPAPARGSLFPWIVAVVAAAGAATLWLNRPEPADAPRLRAAIHLEHQFSLSQNSGVNIQISPNSRWLAYRTREGIRVRPLDGEGTRLLKDTAGTAQFTFSPNGDRIAYAAAGKIRLINVEGGAPIDVCEISSLQPRGVAWINDSTVVFAPRFLGGLSAVSLETGEVKELTTADVEAGERSHRWPTALPDGRSVLFLCQFNKRDYDEGDIRIARLDGGAVTTVYQGGAAPRYAPSGHLLFARDKTVFAVPMDPDAGTTAGMAVPVLSGVWARVDEQEAHDGTAQFDVSPQGVLVYQTEHAGASTRIAGVDVNTLQVRALTQPGAIASLYMSPDGRSIAYRMDGDLHVLDLESGGSRQLTFGHARFRRGAWSPDSRTLYWQGSARDSVLILSQPADGSVPAVVLGSHYGFGRPTDISPDGEWMLITEWPEDRGDDQFSTHILNLTDPEAVSQRLLEEPAVGAKFGPDGKWFSYRMDDPVARGIYLRRFPDTGARWLIHGAQLSYHEWLGDGSGILVHDELGTGRVSIDLTGGTPSIGQRIPLAPTSIVPGWEPGGIVTFSPDGSTIYFLQRDAAEDEKPAIVLVTGWSEELKALAPR